MEKKQWRHWLKKKFEFHHLFLLNPKCTLHCVKELSTLTDIYFIITNNVIQGNSYFHVDDYRCFQNQQRW